MGVRSVLWRLQGLHSMSRFRLISATALLLLFLLEVISGSCIWPPIDSSSSIPKLESTGVSDSSGYRWCSPRCNVSRYPQCCYNPVCRSKKPMGCVWHLYAGANPDMHDDILL